MKTLARALTGALSLVAVLTAAAQSPVLLEEVRSEHLPSTANALLVVDVDGDGLDDLIADGQRLWLNRSSARFVDATATSLPLGANSVQLAADIDGDGDLDLLASGPTVLRNNGRGVFTAVSSGSVGYLPLATGDFDRDGDVDVFAWRRFDSVAVFMNDGGGGFAASGVTPYRGATDLRALVADFDGDRDLDIALAGGDPAMDNFGRNDGSGRMVWSRIFLLDFSVACDLDGDGDQDLASGSAALINDGTGVFYDQSGSRFPGRLTGAMVNLDVDRDGDQDLVFAAGQTWLNDGVGVFTALTVPDLARNQLDRIAVARVDQDRAHDLVAAPGSLFLGRGDGRFAHLNPAALGDALQGGQIADLDGDGDLDVLERLFAGYRTHRNDGSGFFVPLTPVSAWTNSVLGIDEAVADLDGDGDLDVLASLGGPTYGLVSLLNRGDGNFAARPASYTREGVPVSLFLADLDADGDLDALDVNSDGLVVARNDGLGGFASGQQVWAGFTAYADAADFDGDGDLDLALAQERLTLLENRRGQLVDVTDQSFAVRPTGFGRPVFVLLSGRTWLFWPRSGALDVYELVSGSFILRPDLGRTYSGDVAGARRLSVEGGVARIQVLRRFAPPFLAEIWEFDGRSVSDATARLLPAPFSLLLGAADLDTDGDLDIIATPGLQRSVVLRGPARGLRARYAPLIGGSLELVVRDGAALWNRPVPAVGLLGAVRRTPLGALGVLRIDLSGAAVLPPTLLLSAAEVGLTLPVPADPALRDVEVGAQFVHVYSSGLALGALARSIIR